MIIKISALPLFVIYSFNLNLLRGLTYFNKNNLIGLFFSKNTSSGDT